MCYLFIYQNIYTYIIMYLKRAYKVRWNCARLQNFKRRKIQRVWAFETQNQHFFFVICSNLLGTVTRIINILKYEMLLHFSFSEISLAIFHDTVTNSFLL